MGDSHVPQTVGVRMTHDVSMTYFYYAFKLYDGEHKRLAVNEKDR